MLVLADCKVFCGALEGPGTRGDREFRGVRDVLIMTLLDGTMPDVCLHVADRKWRDSYSLDSRSQSLKIELVLTRGRCAASKMRRDEGFEVLVGPLDRSVLYVFMLAGRASCCMFQDNDVNIPSGDCGIERAW